MTSTTAETRKRIAGEVRAEMARQRKTTLWLADLLNLNRSVVSMKLNGRRAFLAEDLATIAEALDVPAAQFLERAA